MPRLTTKHKLTPAGLASIKRGSARRHLHILNIQPFTRIIPYLIAYTGFSKIHIETFLFGTFDAMNADELKLMEDIAFSIRNLKYPQP